MSNDQILNEFIEKVWNQQDFESIESFIDSTYEIYLDTGDPWEGKILDLATFKKRLKYSFDSFPDMHFDLQSTVSDGDHVGISWVMTGTNTGEIGELAATGKSICTSGMTIYHFRNGKIIGHSQVFDRVTVMRQLGFLK
jgi:steroid delta-isomerase-like uncharacterized protein